MRFERAIKGAFEDAFKSAESYKKGHAILLAWERGESVDLRHVPPDEWDEMDRAFDVVDALEGAS